MPIPYGWRGARADVETYLREAEATTLAARLAVIAFSPPLWALVFYRFGRWLYVERTGNRWLRMACKVVHVLVRRPMLWATRVSLPPKCEVGEGVWIAPYDGIWVNPGARIGARARLLGGNTLGAGGRKGARGAPELGDDVVLGPGAIAVGPIGIADGVKIGPNAVAVRSIVGAGTYVGSPPAPWQGEAAASLVAAAQALEDGARLKTKENRMLSRERNELARAPTKEDLFGTAAPRVAFWSAFQADLARYLDPRKRATALAKVRALLAVEGLWALFVYRLGRWALAARSSPDATRVVRALAALAWPIVRVAERVVSLLADIRLDVRAEIAPGLYVGHFKSIYVGPGVKIGTECNIGQMCFLGQAGRGFPAGTPVVGDRVYLGAGCKVVGPVIIGSDAAIGANAVVLSSVPDRAVVVGNPAKVINLEGSADFISVFQHEELPAPKPAAEKPRPEAPPPA